MGVVIAAGWVPKYPSDGPIPLITSLATSHGPTSAGISPTGPGSPAPCPASKRCRPAPPGPPPQRAGPAKRDSRDRCPPGCRRHAAALAARPRWYPARCAGPWSLTIDAATVGASVSIQCEGTACKATSLRGARPGIGLAAGPSAASPFGPARTNDRILANAATFVLDRRCGCLWRPRGSSRALILPIANLIGGRDKSP
ncbi:hypothetical protein ABW41_17540 [Stenotrophomonas maltophilia]|nr:hypothetical protein ABW41_17540 [Stenotrophomonas maltophilia]